MYNLKNKVSKYMKKPTELKREINKSTIRVFNTPPLEIDKTTRKKIKKDTEDLNNTINKLYLINIYIEQSAQQQNTQFYFKHQ